MRRWIADARPAPRITRSIDVPSPTAGGIDSTPVRLDRIPVAHSATTNGREVIVNAFTFAVTSVPRPYGFLHDDSSPAITSTIAKTPAIIGLQLTLAPLSGGAEVTSIVSFL